MRKLTSLFLLVIILIFVFSCVAKDREVYHSFMITGEFVNDYNDSIYIDYGDHRDSMVVKNGRFEFKGTLDAIKNDDKEAFISLRNNGGYGVVFLDSGAIDVKLEQRSTEFEGNVFNWARVVEVKGSRNHAIWDTLVRFRNKHFKEEGFWDVYLEKLKKVNDTASASPMIGRVLFLNAKDNVFSIDSVEEFKKRLDTIAMFSDDVENLNTVINAAYSLQEGMPLKSFVLENVMGEKRSFYEATTSKYTLIDFWASWCAPCYQRNTDLKVIYKGYENVFDVIGISLDDVKEEWLEGIEEQDLQWKNYVVANDWDAEVCKYYGINAIPFNILVDAEGKILKVNLSTEDLEIFLSSL